MSEWLCPHCGVVVAYKVHKRLHYSSETDRWCIDNSHSTVNNITDSDTNTEEDLDLEDLPLNIFSEEVCYLTENDGLLSPPGIGLMFEYDDSVANGQSKLHV